MSRCNFDGKIFATTQYRLEADFSHKAQTKDYWVEFTNEYEVRKRLWVRFTLGKIVTFKLEMHIQGVEEGE